MSSHLGDDGTMDTVIRCDECGAEMRYLYDGEPQGGQVESYDEFVEWCISDFDKDHECEPDDDSADDSESDPGGEDPPGAVPTPASPAPVNGESGGASGGAMQAPCPGCEYEAFVAADRSFDAGEWSDALRDESEAPEHNCKAPHWHYCAECEIGHRCNETTCRGIPNRNCR